MILQEGAPGLGGGLRERSMYLLTLLSPMSKPSLSSSPWMRGAPQPGFSRHILRIRSRTLRERGRPGWPRRTFEVQNRRKPARCQAMTVSSLTWPVRTPVAPDAGKPDPQQAIPGGQFRAFSRGPLKDADLVAQSQVLQLKGSARTKDREQSGEQYRERKLHRKREL
jgi:hypothetical protein